MFTNILFDKVIMKNAKQVHDNMSHTVLNLRQAWYEKNFNIDINFFLSHDMRRIDQIINLEIQNTIEATMYVIGGLFIINYIYRGTILIVNLLVISYNIYIIRLYLKTSQNIIMFISENTQTFQGICNLTIEEIFDYRVMKNEKILENLFQKGSNEMQRAMTHLGFFCKRWLGVRQGWVNTVLIMTGYFTPFFIGVFFDDQIPLTFFQISLSISWSLKLVGFLTTMVNRYINVYDRIISYARMKYFMKRARLERTDADPYEPELDKLKIVAKLRQIDLTLNKKKILKNINLKVQKGEFIGVCGRTGSGKHSLNKLFMRIYDRDGEKYHLNRKRSNLKKRNNKTKLNSQSKTQKKSVKFNKMVEIKEMIYSELNLDSSSSSSKRDSEFQLLGCSTSKINHRCHRRKIHHLDAHPTLFSGRFRENIDPEFKFTDLEIMSAMKYLDGMDVLNQYFIGSTKTDISLEKKETLANQNSLVLSSLEEASLSKSNDQPYETVLNTQTNVDYKETAPYMFTEVQQSVQDKNADELEIQSSNRKLQVNPLSIHEELQLREIPENIEFELKKDNDSELEQNDKNSITSFPNQSTTISKINAKVAREVKDEDANRSIPQTTLPIGNFKHLLDSSLSPSTFRLENQSKELNNNPFQQKVTRSEKYLFRTFLEHTVTQKDCFQIPVALVKFTKAVKALIHQPYILFIDKYALEFSPVSSLNHMFCKYLCSSSIQKSTVFLIFSTKFETLCLMDRIILMEEGMVVQEGSIKEYVKKWEDDFKKNESASPANGDGNHTRNQMESTLLKKIRRGIEHIDKVGKQFYMMQQAVYSSNIIV